MVAKIRYFWCEAICAYLHSNLTNRVRTFSTEQYEIDIWDSEIADDYIQFDGRNVHERQIFPPVCSFSSFITNPFLSISGAVSW